MNAAEQIALLIRDTSTSLPEDVEVALKKAMRREDADSAARMILKTILDNCALARKEVSPLCQDTGTLTFFINSSLRRRFSKQVVEKGVRIATKNGYLRKNVIDPISGFSYDDNCADGAPAIHYCDKPGITLIMKGGGSENMSRQYSLPDSSLGAGRDMAGVRKCILDAVVKAQGYGCAPGVLGVCIGGDRATGYEVAKEQLLRPLDDKAQGELDRFESKLLKEANSLGIGPMGLGGKTTLLGIKIASKARVPASFFVTIAYMCWAARRRTVLV